MLNLLSNLKIKTKFIGSFLILSALTAATGLVGHNNIKQVGDKGINVGENLAPLGDAAMEIKLTAANAHLIFEEIMAGDASEDIEEVWSLLDETLFYIDAVMSGGQNDEGTFIASNDPAVLEKMQIVKGSVEKFIQSARARYENRTSASGTGSLADQDFDSSYEDILKQIDTIIEAHQSDSEYMSVVVSAGKAKFLLADNHLFFEEFLSGDETIKFDDILSGLSDARNEVQSMKGQIGSDKVSPILSHIDKFIAAAKTRHENNAAQSLAGHQVDEAFDSEYESFIALADEAEGIIHAAMDKGLLDLKRQIKTTGLTLMGVIVFSVALALLIGFFLSRSVVNSVTQCLDLSNQISAGDLTGTIDISTLPKDETGSLADALNTMSSNLKDMLNSIQSGVGQLNQSSTELSDASGQIEKNSEQTTQKSAAVAAASEEMSANMNNVAASTDQISSSLQMVASASEEMISTIQEIANNTTRGNEITQNAVSNANGVSEKVKELDKAAQEINKVTETISDISEQTNLLALNATIEAARAGDAGKGFAVVAGEIKTLAQQTADATDEINGKITGVQDNISSSVIAIETIVNIIKDINEIVTTVASAVEEQSATSQEISKNINQAAQGVQEVNTNMNQISTVTAKVAQDVSLVNQGAQETAVDCMQIKSNSQSLDGFSSKLDEMVSKFKI